MKTGSLLVTGTASVVIPLPHKPEAVDAWFDPSCDVEIPHTCSVVCLNDYISSSVYSVEPHNHLGPRFWGIRIKWKIYDNRTRQLYWSAEIPTFEDSCEHTHSDN